MVIVSGEVTKAWRVCPNDRLMAVAQLITYTPLYRYRDRPNAPQSQPVPPPRLPPSAPRCVLWPPRRTPWVPSPPAPSRSSPGRASRISPVFLCSSSSFIVIGHDTPSPVSASHFFIASISAAFSTRASPAHGSLAWSKRRRRSMPTGFINAAWWSLLYSFGSSCSNNEFGGNGGVPSLGFACFRPSRPNCLVGAAAYITRQDHRSSGGGWVHLHGETGAGSRHVAVELAEDLPIGIGRPGNNELPDGGQDGGCRND